MGLRMFDSALQWLSAAGMDGGTALQVLKIIWINILLSGDNAVVIALACRSLPPHQRKWGIILGALVAVAMRIVFTIGVTSLMNTPWIKIVGGLLLFWIAIKLLVEHADENNVKESSSIWGAVQTIAIADIVMSLDNVLAIAAAARGDWTLIILGLVISVPLIVFGATMVMWLLNKVPVLVWAGAALLGFIAGEMLTEDQAIIPYIRPFATGLGLDLPTAGLICGIIGAILVVCIAALLKGLQRPEPKAAG
jgi:YjbE family integral membrane protein